MRQSPTYGSAGALGGQPPRASRFVSEIFLAFLRFARYVIAVIGRAPERDLHCGGPIGVNGSVRRLFRRARPVVVPDPATLMVRQRPLARLGGSAG